MAKILLLDGNSLAYRAFFALPSDMATASGQVTNAVYGFTSMLQFMLNEHRPNLLAVTFDRPEPSFRHEMVTDYKGGRAETPDILRQQMGLIRQVVATLDLPMYELSGYEADDLLATLATQGRDRGDDIIIVTGDRDSYQLVEDPHIRVLYNKRGVTDYALYDEAGIFERTGVRPEQYAEYASLRGDPSDNLPGVPGVGEKTAAKLINEYGNLDGIYENLAKCSPKLRDNLTAAEAQVRSNARAIPLVRDVPGISIDLIRTPEPDLATARELFKTLEFRAMSDRVLDAFAVCFGTAAGPTTATIPDSGEPIHVTINRALRPEHTDGPVAVAALWAGPEGRSPVIGLAVTADGEQVTWLEGSILDEFRPSGPVHGHRVKELLRALPVGTSVGVDTAVAGYLLDPADQAYPLEELALRYAGLDVRVVDGPPPGQLDLTAVAADPAEVAAHQAAAIWHLVKPLNDAMEARGLRALYDEIERPLIAVLAHMETVGVRVDVAYLRALADELTTEAAKAEAEVQAIAGEKFLVNSVPQLRAVLFDKRFVVGGAL